MNPTLSIDIYKQLINGNAINKHGFEAGERVVNPLFDEVFCNIEHYQAQYALLGFELAMLGDAYFLREANLNEQYREAAMRIQVVMEVLARGMSQIPLLPEALMDYKAGLPAADIQHIGEQAEIEEILKACTMKDLPSEVENNLVRRGLALWNLDQALVFTDSGKAFFNELFG